MLRKKVEETDEAVICEFSPIKLQTNPNQTDIDGYPALSKDAVILKKDESARQDVIADVSESFLRDWENKESTSPMWAAFSYNDDTVFLVDLRKQMKDSGKTAN